MVLMRVGEDQTGKILAFLHQITDVGENQIDAGQLFFRGERHAEIDGQPHERVRPSPRP